MPGFAGDAKLSEISRPENVGLRQSAGAIAVAAFAAFGGILFGYDTGTISGIIAMPKFLMVFGKYYDNVPENFTSTPIAGFALSTGEKSLIVSILSAGTFVGALMGAPIADTIGRRWGLQVAMVIFCLGVALQCAASSIPLFTVGRVVAGLGVGVVSTIVPMYQSECAPRWIRGAVVSGYQWCITIGLLLAAIANNGTKDRTDTGAYRIPIAIQFAWAIIMSVGMFILPESPRWLVKRGRTEDAARALGRLNSADLDDPIVRSELADIQHNLEVELTHGNGSYMDCFTSGPRKHFLRSITGILLQAWQQLTGINFIFYYGTTFFQSAIPGKNPFIFTIISNVVNVFSTVPGMYMMEKVGRRKLLVYGAAWMCVCELLVAIIGTAVSASNQSAQKTLVAFVCIYVAGFAATWGPAAWVVCGEIFPLSIRAKALSLCTASNWLWNFGIGYATPYLVDRGPGRAGLGTKVFFIWTATCAGAGIFAFFTIYETAGLSLEEVDELYCQTNPLLSSSANAEVRARRTDLRGDLSRPKDDEESAAESKREATKYETA